MKNRDLFTYLLLFLLLLGVTGCGSERSGNTLMEIARSLGTDVSGGEIVSQSDSHGGFHGDGTTVVEIRLPDTAFTERIEENGEWNPLPLTENLAALVYGRHTEEGSIGPMIHGGDGIPVIPEMEHGYYYFLDRHSQSSNPKDDSGMLDRGSYNVTIAIFDSDQQILYYMELDT